MYIRSLRIDGFRCFEQAEVTFQVPGEAAPAAGGARALPNVTLLLGDNGAGKTSVLRSIALAALGPVLAESSGFVPHSLVRRTRAGPVRKSRVEVTLALQEQDGVKKRAQKAHCELSPGEAFSDRIVDYTRTAELEKQLRVPFSPAFFVVGYGATRRVERKLEGAEAQRKERTPRYARVASLFEDHYALTPLSSWLTRWRAKNKGRHTQVVRLLNQLLPDAELLPDPVDDEYLFRHGGSDVPFSALADGYKAYIGWAADLLYQICLTCPDGARLVDNCGVVLLDEVDLHLHPDWQLTLAPTLARVLPNLQFIVTSHSPLLTGTLGAANIRILKSHQTPAGDPSVKVTPAEEELYGMSADQILTSSVFGLESARDVEFAAQLRAMAAKARDGVPGAALEVMRMMSGGGAAAGGAPPSPPPPGKRARG